MNAAPTPRPTSAVRRLPAAVLGAGLLATALATPGVAAPVPGWTPEHGLSAGYFFFRDDSTVFFQTYDGFDPEDLQLHITPTDASWKPAGESMTVPFTPVSLIDGGRVDVEATRSALGEAGHGPVMYTVTAGDAKLDMAVMLGEDDDLTDGVRPEEIRFDGPQDSSLADRPLEWDTDAWMAPGVAGLEVFHVADTDEGLQVSIVVEPGHGELWPMSDDGGHLSVWYIPEEGFIGEDTFTARFEAGGVSHTQTVQVTVGEDAPAELSGLLIRGVVGGEALDLNDPEVAAVLEAIKAEAGAPTDPTIPTTPSAPSTPAVDEHAVPEKVQTGDAANGWLAGAAAVAAGGLIAARRRLLRTH